ncbi:PEP/pyruvate-binding domain-containing protein [Candidatus Woesearchaeota archaeon]|nr:PEP/pyruvate-binding domain-containing protein [Candidatus Woesearchaeota archaeon]
MKYVLFFSEAGQSDLQHLGLKSINLAMLFKRGFKVPPGFIISSNVFDALLTKTNIKHLIAELLKTPDEALPEKTKNVQRHIKTIEFPEEIADEIIEAYLSLSVDFDRSSASSLLETEEVYVAVRNSSIEENMPKLNLKNILNVMGKDRLFKAILDCFAANFEPDAIKYMKEHKIVNFSSAIIVQKMINSDRSGVAYSVNPETGKKEIVVRACFGLGEGIDSGNIFPDTYVVDRKSLLVSNVKIGEKQYEYVKDIDSDITVRHKLGEKSFKQVLYDKDITEIARILKKIVSYFEKEQRIEWAMRKDIIYVLQTKDLPVKHSEPETPETFEVEIYDSEEEKPSIIDINEPSIEEDLLVLDEIERYEKEEPPAPLVEAGEQEEMMTGFSVDAPSFVSSSELQDEPEEDVVEEVNFEPMMKPAEQNEEVSMFNEPEPVQEAQEADEEPDEMFTNFDEPVEETVEEPDEKQDFKDDSIFSSYKGFDSFNVAEENVDEEKIEDEPEEDEEEPIRPMSNMPNPGMGEGMSKYSDLAKVNAGNTLMYCYLAVKEYLRARLKKYMDQIPEDFEAILNELLEYETLHNADDFRRLNRARNAFVNQMKFPTSEEVGLGLRLANF